MLIPCPWVSFTQALPFFISQKILLQKGRIGTNGRVILTHAKQDAETKQGEDDWAQRTSILVKFFNFLPTQVRAHLSRRVAAGPLSVNGDTKIPQLIVRYDSDSDCNEDYDESSSSDFLKDRFRRPGLEADKNFSDSDHCKFNHSD